MSQSAFEMINNISDIWKIAIQAIMFLVLWTAVFREKKGKRMALLQSCLSLYIWD